MPKILIAGATGGIGRRLVKYFYDKGYNPIPIARSINKSNQYFPYLKTHLEWNDANSILTELYDSDAVINLSGASIGSKRWTKKYRQVIYDSRVLTTRRIVSLLNQVSKPLVLFNASAIGIYPSLGSEDITENTPSGSGFIAEVCKDWEKEVTFLNPRHQLIIGRFGIVLKDDDLALKRILQTYKFGFGVVFDNGENWLSWIYIEDLLNAIDYSIEHNLEGPINFVSPYPIKFKELVKSIGNLLQKNFLINFPSVILKIAFGEMASVLLSSQRVLPHKLINCGFTFRYSKIEEALQEIIH
ncbi:MAG: TIGR01777 family oxidoreductase [Candidatus Kapaibacteriales bacterium]